MFSKPESKRPYSLRRRLMIAVSAGFALLLAILSAGLWTYASAAANQTYDLLLRGAAIAILERISLTPEGVEIDLPPSALDILALAERDRVFYRVVDGAGKTLTGLGDLPLGKEVAKDNAEEPIFFDQTYSGEKVRFVLHGRVLLGLTKPQWIGVEIGQTRLARDAMQQDLFLKGLIPLIALALAGLIAVRLGIGLAMRPLAGIESALRDRSPSDLAPFGAAPPREVESLIVAINDFMRRLAQSKVNAESFIADVAHQMRTSLAALHGQLELASEADAPAAPLARVHQAREQAGRTIRLTNQLLSHAMVIHRGDDDGPWQQVDIADLVRQVIEESLRSNASRSIDFAVDSPATGDIPLIVRGDPIALREALRNLVDNAVRHGPQTNLVTIRWSRVSGAEAGGGAVALCVVDRGPGIPDGEKIRVTERFYARGGSGGSGIGLAIVAAVAASHGGRLELKDAEGGGLNVSLTLPCGSEDMP